jgi:glucose-6-phosphate 1-dehydrogenase
MANRALAATDFVIFGGTGDLALRKLLPALFLRVQDGQLPATSRIIAVSRSGLDDADYRGKVRGALPEFVPGATAAQIDAFCLMLSHVPLGGSAHQHAGWATLTKRIEDDPKQIRVFYLAVGPDSYASICRQIGEHGLVTADSRVVLEKPIGRDLATAREINTAVTGIFDESQIYRIDHYLGKESVQNLLTTRFANSVFEPLWNARAIDHVEITVAETLGVEERGGYYDSAGAIRDMLQNHLLQLLCLVAMEPPNVVSGESVRDEKVKVLHALRPLNVDDIAACCVRGQYVAGAIDGRPVASYSGDLRHGHRESSTTETFVAIKAEIANWRWAGVPFYLRTGKRMESRRSEIVIVFKPVPHPMFPQSDGSQEANRLVFRLQPDESVQLHLMAREPGPGGIRLRRVALDLNYQQAFGTPAPDAYERLLMDVVRGNPTHFMRGDEIEAAWRWVEPLLSSPVPPKPYAAGSDGPTAAHALIASDGRAWHEEN